MKFLSEKEYLDLIESSQMDEEEYEQLDDYDLSNAWIPAESPNKDKMLRAKSASAHRVIDILNYPKDKIKDAIYNSMNLQVGEFLIIIEKYHGHPKDKQLSGTLTLDVNIMQTKYKTPSGFPCKMSYFFNFFKDRRFSNCSWIANFNSSGSAENISSDQLVEIIKYLQFTQRFTVFL
jgi:hypothetical protein